ncbi:MAG: Gfo/Idh/MocA family oxidoreductase [Phycisphaerales bacterium]|nr:Gfo/Idh/MocA family oxidoreductase [Phycisphaerales bacterium]
MSGRRRLTRRTFIRHAGVAAIASPQIIPSLALGAAGMYRPAPSNRITMGLIGCGGMGQGNLRSFLRQGDVQVLAVCDPDTQRRESAKRAVDEYYADQTTAGTYHGCAAYNDFRDLLARDDIDTIIQATPDHWHALVVIAAARAGKDIYGEKPLSLTISQGRAMSDAVARYGRVFQTGSQQRSDSRFRFACELVRNGRIGTVRRVTCGLPTTPTTGNHPPQPVPDGFDYDLWLGPAPWAPFNEYRTHWNFRWILDYSGGQVTDWGAHHIDIAHWGLGLTDTGPVHVEGVGEFPIDGLYDAATNYRFTCTYATGVQITVTNDFENGVKWEGDDGWVFVNRGRIDAEPKSLLSDVIGPNEIQLPRSKGHHRDFLECVRSRREPIAPIEHAHRTITVSHLGNIAMQIGRAVRWNPQTEMFVDDPQAERMADRAMREPWRL